MENDQLPAAAAPALVGARHTPTAYDPDALTEPGFATLAEEDAYWHGIEVGARAAGRTPPLRPRAYAAAGPASAALASALPADPAPPPVTAETPAPTPSTPTPRHDGWTPERQQRFLSALAECGVVEDAARHAGMSKQSAYGLRQRAAGRAFALAWEAALRHARRRLADELLSRALKGCTETVEREGVVVGTRHRHDNRLSMAVLTRLDRETAKWDAASKTVTALEADWDELLGVIGTGDADAADAFVAAHAPPPPTLTVAETVARQSNAALMAKIAEIDKYDGVHPALIDVSDLSEDDDMEEWTDDQWARADRSGFFARVMDKRDAEDGDAGDYGDEYEGDDDDDDDCEDNEDGDSGENGSGPA